MPCVGGDDTLPTVYVALMLHTSPPTKEDYATGVSKVRDSIPASVIARSEKEANETVARGGARILDVPRSPYGASDFPCLH